MAESNENRDPSDITKLEKLNSGRAGKFISNCFEDWSGMVNDLP